MSSFFYRGPRFRKLHEQYAKCGRLDTAAQHINRHTVHVEAPPEAVWEVVGHPERWSDLGIGFSRIRLPETTVDGDFRFHYGIFPVRARLAEVEPNRRISWTGSVLGLYNGIDRNIIEPRPDGTTDLTVEESLAGPGVQWAHPLSALVKGHQRRLAAIKAAVERRSGSPR